MFEKVNVPVLGLIENMSFFVCHKCDERHDIFRHGGGKKVSEELRIPFLGEIPIDPAIVLGGDAGVIVDMPPGTGDAQLTLTQSAPLAGAVIITTPQDVSLIDARRGLRMFEKVNVPVLGLIENMSFFVCHKCDERHDIFRHGGGKKVSEELRIPFLGEIPIDPAIVLGGDAGVPIVEKDPESAAAKAYQAIAANVAARLSIGAMDLIDPADLKLQWKAASQS